MSAEPAGRGADTASAGAVLGTRRPLVGSRPFVIVATILLGGMALTGVLSMPISRYLALNARPFSSELWKKGRPAPNDYDDNPRYQMIGDLIERVGLEGRTLAEVEALLGPADGGRETWELGPGQVFLETDAAFLIVRLGPDGRVESVRHP